jgi:two-component system, NarL family, nitrate/nitrite response regulator NarL
MDRTRLLVVDETPGLAQDLLLALRRKQEFQVLGPVPDETAAIDAFVVVPVDLVVVQLDRRDGRGVAIVAALRERATVRVMAATRRPASSDVELALAAGACGVLPIEREPARLVGAFRRVLAGELVLPVDELPTVVDHLRQARPRRTELAVLATLTHREHEILRALAEGATTTEVADALGIAPGTVRTHVKNILGKLGVHSKVEAVGAAWRAGLAVGARSA